jgi:hypothetical protein
MSVDSDREAKVNWVLASLRSLDESGNGDWSSAVDISRHLRDGRGVDIHWRTIDALLGENRSFVSRRKRLSRWEYKLMENGRAALSIPDEAVTFVNPETALQSTLKLHDILRQLAGEVSVCDPYLDHLTLEHLEACGKGRRIRVLTQKVNDSGPLRRVFDSANLAGYRFDVRVAIGKPLHDRYVIDDRAMLILGASLNGFGKKQSFVIQVGSDVRKPVMDAFNSEWMKAIQWP